MTNTADLLADPFGETAPTQKSLCLQVLGASCLFESDSGELLRLVAEAYAGLPAHRLAETIPQLRIKLVVNSSSVRNRRAEPPAVSMLSGLGFLGGTTLDSSWVMLSPRTRTALVVVSPRMLRFAYHVRYEYIEFAVFTLAARVQRLVPLHAACVGHAGQGVLLMGPSGTGKSTVALHGLLHGLEFIAEDAVFVTADRLQATGIANYLHVTDDSLHWLERPRERAAIRRSPTIRRRSGVEKFEVNLRRPRYRLAQSPLKIAAVVFLSSAPAGDGPLLRRLSRKDMLSSLNSLQAYAAGQPRWHAFARNLSRLEAFELRRGSHPREAVGALRELLGAEAVALESVRACASR